MKQAVIPHLSWELDEIRLLLQAVEAYEYERGEMGQSLYMLLAEDPNIVHKMISVAIQAADADNEEAAYIALYLHLYWLGEDAPQRFTDLMSSNASLR
ncbi:MAG: hypothetical protein M3151_00330, partial [Actinomycetota bacterium]|nr:hypothetical protein [Actinomycetota bacterium]